MPPSRIVLLGAITMLLAGCQTAERSVPGKVTLPDDDGQRFAISIKRYGYPYLTITINDRPIEVFLDTGNMSGLFLSERVIRDLDLPVIRSTNTYDSDGRPTGQANVYGATTMGAFGDQWRDVQIQQRDVPGANGAIGPPYLKGKRFKLDYTKKTLTVWDSHLPVRPEHDDVLELIPVERLEGMIVVRGRVGAEEVLMQIDTGKSRTCIDPDLARRLDLPESSGGFRIDDLRLGSHQFSIPSAKGVRFRGISDGLDRPIEIGIGSDVLKDVVMTIDYLRQVAIFQKP